MSFPPAIGAWVSFYAEPDSVALCVPVPGARRFCGQVVAVTPLPASQPGNIPDCCLTVRGRSGKRVSFAFVAHYTTIHASKDEAIADTLSPAITYHEDIPKPQRAAPASGTRHARSHQRFPMAAR